MDAYFELLKNLLNDNFEVIKSEKEFKFHSKRKWRVDYYFEIYAQKRIYKIAVEIEGGVWIYGRHNRAKSFLKDMEKYNALTKQKIFLLRYTPQQFKKINFVFEDIKELLTKKESEK